jgi:hypothetical protein
MWIISIFAAILDPSSKKKIVAAIILQKLPFL